MPAETHEQTSTRADCSNSPYFTVFDANQSLTSTENGVIEPIFSLIARLGSSMRQYTFVLAVVLRKYFGCSRMMRSKMTSAAYGAGAQTNIRASGFIDNASRTACAIANVLPVPGGPKHTSGATVRSFILLFALFALLLLLIPSRVVLSFVDNASQIYTVPR